MKVVRDILGGRREQLTDEIENQSIRLHHPIRETITTGIVEILDIKIDGGEYEGCGKTLIGSFRKAHSPPSFWTMHTTKAAIFAGIGSGVFLSGDII